MASDRGLIQKCFDRKNAHAALRVTMATGRHLLNLVVVFFVTASLACSSGQSAQTQLQIRILNLTKSAMDNLWLGAGPRGGADCSSWYFSDGCGRFHLFRAPFFDTRRVGFAAQFFVEGVSQKRLHYNGLGQRRASRLRPCYGVSDCEKERNGGDGGNRTHTTVR